MKVLVIGASGTLGSAVATALEKEHQVVRASRSGPVTVDLEDSDSLDALFAGLPDLDAVVCCAVSGPMVDFATATDEEFLAGLQGKLLGQIALARRAQHHLRDGGSITLTGGTFTTPMVGGSLGAVINTGLEGFVRNAAAELPRDLRINLVSPGWIAETLQLLGRDPAPGILAVDAARSYVTAVEGRTNGETLLP
ncbi:short chain dehydrogenase [Kitasatospora xanthocidica]|uniref:Short chain dehydrogenase n=1 Tax=Kitasatospora xanthocidica TaxID=83382 RepID=A0A372ZLP7_9ACTN|nr:MULTISPECIES: short chain dehydrogenase [Streptomycetaceae]OKI11503.1 short-chain dehydrogenase [Streptomyces sp. CB02056]RGD56671.1 short chain dehydrogenase [Kitasatospora xanthocidica]